MPLAPPLDDPSRLPAMPPLSAQARERFETTLDNTCAVSVPQPKSPEEERALVARFLSGLDKLFQRENNWTFLQPLVLTMEHCAKCQTCSEACHVFEASGGAEIYRPTFRSEIMRRLYFKHVRHGGLFSAWQHGDITVNWPLVSRLAESFGSQCVVAAVDVKRIGGRLTVVVNGGREETPLEALAWIRELETLGAGEILLTSMDRDGTGSGYDLELLRGAAAAATIPIIASGGAGNLGHLAEALEAGAHGVLAATIFHFRGSSLPEARAFLRERGYPVRP